MLDKENTRFDSLFLFHCSIFYCLTFNLWNQLSYHDVKMHFFGLLFIYVDPSYTLRKPMERLKYKECILVLCIWFQENITCVLWKRETIHLTAQFQLIKYRSHLLSGGLIWCVQSGCCIQLDVVGGAQRSGFRQLKVILGSGLFQRLKAYFMVLFIHSG